MKSTKQDFEQYVAHCKYWMKHLSLGNYTYAFLMQEDDHDARIIHGDPLCITVVIAEEREGFSSVPMLARHEMLEVLVDGLADGLYSMYSDEWVQEKRHGVIQRLEKILTIPTDKEVGYSPKRKKK